MNDSQTLSMAGFDMTTIMALFFLGKKLPSLMIELASGKPIALFNMRYLNYDSIIRFYVINPSMVHLCMVRVLYTFPLGRAIQDMGNVLRNSFIL